MHPERWINDWNLQTCCSIVYDWICLIYSVYRYCYELRNVMLEFWLSLKHCLMSNFNTVPSRGFDAVKLVNLKPLFHCVALLCWMFWSESKIIERIHYSKFAINRFGVYLGNSSVNEFDCNHNQIDKSSSPKRSINVLFVWLLFIQCLIYIWWF